MLVHLMLLVCCSRDTSALFVTSSFQDVRVWSPDKDQELLRINVPNKTCNAVEVAPDGRSIITGKHNSVSALNSEMNSASKTRYSMFKITFHRVTCHVL